jgi:hypothetical protein
MAISLTLFLSEDEFKTVIPASGNLKVTEGLKQSIWHAQQTYVYDVLCPALYDELILQVSTNTVTAANQTLLNNLKEMLAWYSHYCYIVGSTFKIREMGPTRLDGPGTVGDMDDVADLRKFALSAAENMKLRLIRFLNENIDDYPLWRTSPHCTCGSGDACDKKGYYASEWSIA